MQYLDDHFTQSCRFFQETSNVPLFTAIGTGQSFSYPYVYSKTVFNTLHPAVTSMFEEKLLCPYRYDEGKRLWRVVHSMHASMEEVYMRFCTYLFLPISCFSPSFVLSELTRYTYRQSANEQIMRILLRNKILFFFPFDRFLVPSCCKDYFLEKFSDSVCRFGFTLLINICTVKSFKPPFQCPEAFCYRIETQNDSLGHLKCF